MQIKVKVNFNVKVKSIFMSTFWSNMAWCGLGWVSVDQCGSVWLDVYGLIWLGVGQFGCGSVWVSVDQYGSVWISVGQCGFSVDQCGSVLVSLGQFGSVWVIVGQCG